MGEGEGGRSGDAQICLSPTSPHRAAQELCRALPSTKTVLIKAAVHDPGVTG